MIIKNEEYDILIRSPQGISFNCSYFPVGTCSNKPEFDLFFKDDEGKIFKIYNDICSRHLIIAIIEGISR